eukprot:4828768-Alexandrium_andersonii.AAC.1
MGTGQATRARSSTPQGWSCAASRAGTAEEAAESRESRPAGGAEDDRRDWPAGGAEGNSETE